MNNMKFDIDKVKIKYILGTHKDSSAYPTGEDILYYIVRRAVDRSEDLNDITFTKTKLLKKLGEVNEVNVQNGLAELIATGYTESIRESKDSQTYRIIKNPYISNGI